MLRKVRAMQTKTGVICYPVQLQVLWRCCRSLGASDRLLQKFHVSGLVPLPKRSWSELPFALSPTAIHILGKLFWST